MIFAHPHIIFEPHIEVWLLIAASLGLGIYAGKVLMPRIDPHNPIRTVQKVSFFAAIAVLWLASDWPIHDISEEYLYFVHMIQHFMITLIVPPLLLIAIPEKLALLVVAGPNGEIPGWLRRLANPILAGAAFNGLIALSHLPWFVNRSVENGIFHYSLHLVMFTSAMLMWMLVCGPIKELRLKPTGQMVYLFIMSLLPTIPAAFLTFADEPVYEAYNGVQRLWGISAVSDQQAAGLIMKLVGGAYLWSIVGYIFFKWIYKIEKKEQQGIGVSAEAAASAENADSEENADSKILESV